MRTLQMIVLGATLVGSVCVPASLFAQSGDTTNCAIKLTTFVKDLDELLARNPRDLLVIREFLYRHLPIPGCTAEVASQAMRTSAYFKEEVRGRAGRSTQFSLFNGTTFSRGAAILLVLNETGDWEPPFVLWQPPYP